MRDAKGGNKQFDKRSHTDTSLVESSSRCRFFSGSNREARSLVDSVDVTLLVSLFSTSMLPSNWSCARFFFGDGTCSLDLSSWPSDTWSVGVSGRAAPSSTGSDPRSRAAAGGSDMEDCFSSRRAARVSASSPVSG